MADGYHTLDDADIAKAGGYYILDDTDYPVLELEKDLGDLYGPAPDGGWKPYTRLLRFMEHAEEVTKEEFDEAVKAFRERPHYPIVE